MRDLGVAAPDVGDLVEIDGRWGIEYERLEGPTLAEEAILNPARAPELAAAMARLHLAVHRVILPGLTPYRVRAAEAVLLSPLPESARLALLGELDRLPVGSSLCHGDFHPQNIILAPSGPCIIDWDSAFQGPPAADAARSLLLIQWTAIPEDATLPDLPGLRRLFAGRYRRDVAAAGEIRPDEWSGWLRLAIAARLSEGIPGEAALLLKMLRRAQKGEAV